MPVEVNIKTKLDALFNYREPHWTYDAICCYKRGCVCRNCPMSNLIGKQCQLKGLVIELVRVIGRPRNVTMQQIIEV